MPPAFGMYTRRTGIGSQLARLRCTRTAISARSGDDKATSPSIPGRPTPGIALGHLPHAHQRVRPRTQHQFLQRPDRGPVLLPRRLEDPASQPDYVLLMSTPVDEIPLHSDVLGSVHHDGVQLAPSVHQAISLGVQRLTCPRQHPFESGRYRPASGRFPMTTAWSSSHAVASPVAFRPPASASWASCPRRGIPPLLRSAYRTDSARTPTGFPRSTHTRYGRGGRPLYPETSGVPTTGSCSPVAACRPFQRPGPITQVFVPSSRVRNNEASSGVHSRSPARPSPRPVAPPDGTGALRLLPWASHPNGQDPSTHARAGIDPEH